MRRNLEYMKSGCLPLIMQKINASVMKDAI